MRRLAAIVVLAALGAAAALLAGGCGAGGSPDYRVDAIFDSAKGIVPGQIVKIAGARVGEVSDVVLTPDSKARVEMTIDKRFAPFRTDARCQILPQGLISENFVECSPGTPAGGELRARGGQAPTVPVERTAIPLDLQDLFNVFSVPVDERLTILVNELGIGLSGRGEDLNAVLRRANPTLQDARKVLRMVGAQRRALRQAISDGDRAVGALAEHRQGVQRLLEHAAGTARQAAAHQDDLAAGLHELPPLLDQARPALQRLDALANAGTPLLADLRASAPALRGVVSDLRPFAHAAGPALAALGDASRQGRRTVRDAAPVVAQLRGFAHDALPAGRLVDQLFVSLRDRGFVEALLTMTYRTAALLSRYDDISHLLPSQILVSPCVATPTSPDCDAHLDTRAARRDRAQTKTLLDWLLK